MSADCFPVFSTITNLVDIILKVGIDQSFLLTENNRYYSYIEQKSYTDCFWLLIPVVGNYWVRWYQVKNLLCEELATSLSIPQRITDCCTLLGSFFSAAYATNNVLGSNLSADPVSCSLLDESSESEEIILPSFESLVLEVLASENQGETFNLLQGRYPEIVRGEEFLIAVVKQLVVQTIELKPDEDLFFFDSFSEPVIQETFCADEQMQSPETVIKIQDFFFFLFSLKLLSEFVSLVGLKDKLLHPEEIRVENREDPKVDSIEDFLKSFPVTEQKDGDSIEKQEESDDDWGAVVASFLHQVGYTDENTLARIKMRIIEDLFIDKIVRAEKPAKMLKQCQHMLQMFEKKEELLARLFIVLDQEEHMDFERYDNSENAVEQFLIESGVKEKILVRKVKEAIRYIIEEEIL